MAGASVQPRCVGQTLWDGFWYQSSTSVRMQILKEPKLLFFRVYERSGSPWEAYGNSGYSAYITGYARILSEKFRYFENSVRISAE